MQSENLFFYDHKNGEKEITISKYMHVDNEILKMLTHRKWEQYWGQWAKKCQYMVKV